ncbi:HAMP domain-containing sensor histidine kinase [Neisseriaceae bacterium ESL0693]|nr:HAMP domain-containing sensor histidine kinase [Neisseriaceae bacterium ESL0693]
MNVVPDNWQSSLDRLATLLNIARISVLISVITFWVLTRDIAIENDISLPVFSKTQLYSWAIIYNGFVVVSLIVPRWQNQTEALPNARSVVDISMIAWLMQMAGGIGSGFGMLLLPFVSAACLLSRGRYPMLYAGYATLLVMMITYWQYDNHHPLSDNVHLWATAVMLCTALFLLAGLTAYAATFLARSQQTQAQQSKILDSYKQLLDRAFNDVQEAVVVLDVDHTVWLMNSKANDYFSDARFNSQTHVFQPVMNYWQQCQQSGFEIVCVLNEEPMRVRVRVLNEANTSLLMLFIRTQHELEQEAMAIKLAALGLLTANLAHEIRNPMSAIRQANELLQEDEENSVRQRLFSIVNNNIDRIDKMLEDISILSKSKHTRRKLIYLNQFWQTFYQEFILTTPAAASCIQLKADHERLTVWCDPAHLQQIMWNLMNNAWRHSQKNQAAIRVLFRDQGLQQTTIAILDNGEGVSMENRKRLFEPFFTTAVNGTGLGLYIARELAQSNQGQLNYQPQINGFELILPRSTDA